MHAQRPTFVFEWIPELELLLTYQGSQNPRDDEWEVFLRAIDELNRRPNQYRYLTISEGGHPTAAQQARIRAVAHGKTPPVSIISTSIAMRFVVSVLALVNPRIQCFRPDQKARAYEHVGFMMEDIQKVEAHIARVRAKLVGTARAA